MKAADSGIIIIENGGEFSMGRRTSLFIRSVSHLFVDALCAAILYSSGAGFLEISVYDTLAFSTQCVTGMIADRYRTRLNIIAAASCALIAGSFFAPAGIMVRAAAAGIGNSFFHTSAGAAVIRGSKGKASPLGAFVAPGAIGLTLGTVFPAMGPVFAAGILICAVLMMFLRDPEESVSTEEVPSKDPGDTAVMLLLFAAVAVRAFAGSAVEFEWKSGAAGALIMTAAVFAGKFAGGFIADRTDLRIMSAVSVTAASLLTAFGHSNAVLSLAGQFLINLTMPVTLWLMCLAAPEEPGFAFGLAAAALWPGVLAGILVSLTGPWRALCVIVCFACGTAAILYSVRKLKDGGKMK